MEQRFKKNVEYCDEKLLTNKKKGTIMRLHFQISKIQSKKFNSKFYPKKTNQK